MVALSVVAIVWVINLFCIVIAARTCSISLSHVVACAVLLGPLAWFMLCLKLRELAPGRVSVLPSPLRKVADFAAIAAAAPSPLPPPPVSANALSLLLFLPNIFNHPHNTSNHPYNTSNHPHNNFCYPCIHLQAELQRDILNCKKFQCLHQPSFHSIFINSWRSLLIACGGAVPAATLYLTTTKQAHHKHVKVICRGRSCVPPQREVSCPAALAVY